MGEVLVFLTDDTSRHSQGLLSALYYFVIIQNGNMISLLILNVDRHLVIYLEKRLVPGHSEGDF